MLLENIGDIRASRLKIENRTYSVAVKVNAHLADPNASINSSLSIHNRIEKINHAERIDRAEEIRIALSYATDRITAHR
jgi:hypothetical protein